MSPISHRKQQGLPARGAAGPVPHSTRCSPMSAGFAAPFVTLVPEGRSKIGRVLFPALSLLAVALAPSFASAQSTNATTNTSPRARPEYSAFKLITDRNIFNPRRYPRSTERRETRRSPSAEQLTLVGTMSYEKGQFAFFDGTRSDYRKVVKAAEEIAGLTVAEITPNHVKLAAGTNALQVIVGHQIRREPAGVWELAGRVERSAGPAGSLSTRSASGGFAADRPAASASGQNTDNPTALADVVLDAVATDPTAEAMGTNAPPEAAGSPTDDPVLRRLMQRREQEINR